MIHKLLCSPDEDVASVRARVFGVLVKMAAPSIEIYHSDFYHDARWLTDNLADGLTFFYSFDSSGTYIGTDPTHVLACGDNRYRLTLRRASSWWTLAVDDMAGVPVDRAVSA